MSETKTMRRPFGVTLVALIVGIAAVLNVTFGVLMIFSIFGSNPTISDPLGNDHVIGGGWLIFNGTVTLILGLLYFWLIKMIMIGSTTAQFIIQMLVVINIVFSIFNLPYGWWTILVNVFILILVSGTKATMWFRQTN